MQIISTDKTVGSNTVYDVKDFNSQNLSTQVEKRRTSSFFHACYSKSFDLMGHDRVEISTENKSLKNEIDSHDEKCLDESKGRFLKHIDDEKRANKIMSRMEKQMKKQ